MESPIKGYRMRGITALSAVCVAGLVLAACEGSGYEPGEPQVDANPIWEPGEDRSGSIFGSKGLLLFSTEEDRAGVEGGGGIGVNSFLWRASLDTISFMPVNSADPFGGVIITDWYAPPESVNERFKMTVYILSRNLRSDGLKVAVFRQFRDEDGSWIDGEVSEGTARQLEDGILSRARELRVAGLAE